jgi:hypothetical protein
MCRGSAACAAGCRYGSLEGYAGVPEDTEVLGCLKSTRSLAWSGFRYHWLDPCAASGGACKADAYRLS